MVEQFRRRRIMERAKGQPQETPRAFSGDGNCMPASKLDVAGSIPVAEQLRGLPVLTMSSRRANTAALPDNVYEPRIADA